MKRFTPLSTVRRKLLFLAIRVEFVMLTILVGNSLRLLHNFIITQTQWQAEQIAPVPKAA